MKYKDRKGSALLLVILILMVVSLLGMTMIDMTIIHIHIGIADRLHQAAYYYAEAALQHQIEVMANYMESLYRDTTISSDRNYFYNCMVNAPIQVLSFEESEEQPINIKITSQYEGIKNDAACFTIYSKCTIGKIRRIVKARVEVRWVNPEDLGFRLDKDNFKISRWGEIYEEGN